MRITIVGCGALGSLLGARLMAAGHQLQVFQRAGRQQDALKANGIIIGKDKDGSEKRFKPERVSGNPEELKPAQLVIVLVKAYQTETLDMLPGFMTTDGVVLTMQNGLGNAETLAGFVGTARLTVGVATYGAYKIAPGVVGWGGDGQVALGAWQDSCDYTWVADLLNNAGMITKYIDQPLRAVWRKLTINCMINPVTALTRLRNGDALNSFIALDLMKKLGQETVQAATQAGVDLDFDQVWAAFLKGLPQTAVNKSSMLQDVENGTQTEIDAISGAVLKFRQKDTDFPNTQVVYSLIKAIDNSLVK